MRQILIICIFLLQSIFLNASVLDIQNSSNIYFGKNTIFFEDVNSEYNIQDIKQLPKNSFQPLKDNVHGELFTNSTFWYKFEVKNNSSENKKRYFVFDLPWIDNINLYIINNEKQTSYKIGNRLQFKERSKKVNLINHSHNFQNGISTIYMEIKTRDPFLIPLSLLSEEEFNHKIYSEHIIEFSIYSIIISMILFNFLLYFIIKNNTYLYYVAFLGSYLFMSFAYNNYLFQFILFNMPEFQNWLQSIGVLLFPICGLFFAQSFLNLNIQHSKLNKLTKFIIFIYFLFLINIFFLDYHQHIIIAITSISFFTLYTIVIAFYSYQNGNKSALFFIIGSIFGLIGAFVTSLCVMSVIPYNWLLFKAVDFGMIIDSILLSLALANRYNIVHSSLKTAEKNLQQFNDNLENTIIQRTKELNIELGNKNILIKEISHRVKNNLQIITALFSMEMNKINDMKAKQVIEDNIQRIKSMSILYEKFLYSQDLEHISVKEYITKIAENFNAAFNDKNIIYNLNISDIAVNSKNLIPLGLIINELITNSKKHAFNKHENPIIDILIKIDEEKRIKLIYKDNGNGTDISIVKKGFGFKLLKALAVHQLQGLIECKNNQGLQYTIKFHNDKN